MRSNTDKIVNDQGQHLIELCIEFKLRFLNGRFVGDSLGYHTYYGPRGSSAIDYFTVSEDLFYVFSFVNILPPSELSDHSVIWSGLNIGCLATCSTEADDTNCHMLPGKYLIDEASKQKYVASLNDDESRHLLQLFVTSVDDQNTCIDTLTKQLSDIIQTAASKSTKFKRFSRVKKKRIHFRQKWFNGNCFIMKKELRNLVKKLQRNPNNPDVRASFHSLKKEYNKTLKKTKYDF